MAFTMVAFDVKRFLFGAKRLGWVEVEDCRLEVMRLIHKQQITPRTISKP
jgi:hypothetical protein